MKINYQVMTEDQKNEHGNYVPDYEKLIAGATCQEEAEYIKKMRASEKELIRKPGFAYNMVYITRQTCGHFEIFQSPCNEHYPLLDILDDAVDFAQKRKCTRCVCNWRKFQN